MIIHSNLSKMKNKLLPACGANLADCFHYLYGLFCDILISRFVKLNVATKNVENEK